MFNKDDEFNKVNCRRVTFLPVLNNIYERLLAKQLLDFVSCETALLRLTEDWRSLRKRGELVAVVSMDLSKAFDVV